MSIIYNALQKHKEQQKKHTELPAQKKKEHVPEVVRTFENEQEKHVARIQRHAHEGRKNSSYRGYIIFSICLIVCLIGGIFVWDYMYEEPIPVLPKAPIVTSDIKTPQMQFICSGIVYDPQDPQCFINGKIVGLGDIVDGARVMAINTDTITLMYKGKTVRLPLVK